MVSSLPSLQHSLSESEEAASSHSVSPLGPQHMIHLSVLLLDHQYWTLSDVSSKLLSCPFQKRYERFLDTDLLLGLKCNLEIIGYF